MREGGRGEMKLDLSHDLSWNWTGGFRIILDLLSDHTPYFFVLTHFLLTKFLFFRLGLWICFLSVLGGFPPFTQSLFFNRIFHFTVLSLRLKG